MGKLNEPVGACRGEASSDALVFDRWLEDNDQSRRDLKVQVEGLTIDDLRFSLLNNPKVPGDIKKLSAETTSTASSD